MDEILDSNNPSSSDLNNDDAIEIQEEGGPVIDSVSGPQNVIESRLESNENTGSYWRYFFKPQNPGQTKVKCRICSKEISRGKDQSTSSLLSHLESQHNKFHGLLKQAREAEKKRSFRRLNNISLMIHSLQMTIRSITGV